VHQPATVAVALNSHALWVALMIGLTVTNYGYPILALTLDQGTSVPAVYVGAQR
jgi:cytochrome c oxidase subunit 1